MTMAHVLKRYETEVRIGYEEPGMTRQAQPDLVRLLREDPARAFIRYSRLTQESADLVIREQLEEFERLSIPLEWEVHASDSPDDLAERLQAHGFQPELGEGDPGAMLVLDLTMQTPLVGIPSDQEIRNVLAGEDLTPVGQVEAEVWGGDFEWLLTRLAADLTEQDYLAVFVGYVGPKPAACAWTYYLRGTSFAVLRGGSTLPEFRRQGLYSALVATRIAHARDLGYRYLVVEAAPASRPILENLGFHVLSYVNYFSRSWA